MKKTDLFIFDVNTLVSAFLIGSFTNNPAFRKALEIGLVICTNKIKKELSEVFLREKFDNMFHSRNESAFYLFWRLN